MDKWNYKNTSFYNWLFGNPPEPGDPDFEGPPELSYFLNKRTITNPFTSTKLDDYLILAAVLYGVYKYVK